MKTYSDAETKLHHAAIALVIEGICGLDCKEARKDFLEVMGCLVEHGTKTPADERAEYEQTFCEMLFPDSKDYELRRVV